MTISRQKIIFALALIVLLGLFLRLYDLHGNGLWLDEGGSVMKTDADLKQFMSGRQPYISPPLYYLFLGSWIKFFGSSEISIRFPSVLFGTLSILMLYRIGKIVFDETAGLIGALIIATSTFQIYFSQEARMYSLLLLLSLSSIYYFILLLMEGVVTIREEKRKIRWVPALFYLLSSILLLYTHNFGISPLIVQNILALVLILKTRRIGRMKLKIWVILQSILLLAFLPWIVVIIKQFFNIQGNYWSPPVTPGILRETLLSFSGSYWLLVFFLTFSIISLILNLSPQKPKSLYVKTHGEDKSPLPVPLFLFTWLSVPCLLPFLISVFSTPIYISRITISASPALYLMAAGGIRLFKKTSWIIVSLCLFALLSIPVLWNYYHTTRNEPMQEVISRVEDEVQPGDIILISPFWYKKFIFDYYYARKDIPAQGFSSGIITPEALKELTDLSEEYRRIWIILCQGEDFSPLLRNKFPIRFSPSDSRIINYFNFQAGKEMAIRVYLLKNHLPQI